MFVPYIWFICAFACDCNNNNKFNIPEIYQSGYRTFQKITIGMVQNESQQYDTYKNDLRL